MSHENYCVSIPDKTDKITKLLVLVPVTLPSGLETTTLANHTSAAQNSCYRSRSKLRVNAQTFCAEVEIAGATAVPVVPVTATVVVVIVAVAFASHKQT